MTTPSPLHLEIRGPLARVTLNRPEIHNAFDDGLIDHLYRAAQELRSGTGLRVVVLRGEGKSFCAGADLNWMKRMVDYSQEENRADSEAMARMFEAWNSLPFPVVGRVQGAAIGGGVGLVSVCDFVVASDRAVFGFSEVRLGILPAVIGPFVLDKIGVGAARAWFLTGDRFSAHEAQKMGLVHKVTTPDEIDHAVEEVVESLLAGGPEAQARIKRLIPEIAHRSPEAVRDLTVVNISEARVGDEGQDGIRAFLERRPSSWREDV